MALVANEGFQHILRVLNTNVDGRTKIMYALTSIRGIGRRFANIVCKKADVDLNKRAGELSAAELENLMVIVGNPRQFKIPDWFLNRQKDYKDGRYSQVVSNGLDMKMRDDLERLKKIRNHRGLRHYWGLRVRGQHTKTTGRRGRTVAQTDELMGEEELDASFSVDSFFVEEAVMPAVSAPPPAKRVCAAGSSSSAPVAPPAAPVVPPVTPVMAPVAGPSTATPAPSASTQEANPVIALAITGRYSRLRRNRDSVGVVVAALVRDTDAVVVLLFPESLEAHRSRIITRVRSILRGRDFAGGRVPVFEASAGDLLRLPRKSYCRHTIQWPTVDDANRFKRMLPITYRSSEGPTAKIKVFLDPAPDFSAAKARGETVLVLRNVPVGFAVRTLHALLMSSSTDGVRWLGDLLSFHKLFDPYEESFLPKMLGIAVASPNDPLFEAIPAVI
ncbi:unnamed protein product [Closterium sp. Naga37s-1]|nr:unnamed protein product [Closterium sp. Naga37s-1]